MLSLFSSYLYSLYFTNSPHLYAFLTICGLCIMIELRNSDQQDALFFFIVEINQEKMHFVGPYYTICVLL